MAITYPNSGLGTVVAFTSSTEHNSLQLTSIDWDGGTVNAIPTSHYGLAAEGANEMGNATFMASRLIDGGSFTFEYSFNANTRIVRGTTDTVTITWPDGTGNWAFTGIVTSAPGAFPIDERMTQTVTVKVASKITITDEP